MSGRREAVNGALKKPDRRKPTLSGRMTETMQRSFLDSQTCPVSHEIVTPMRDGGGNTLRTISRTFLSSSTTARPMSSLPTYIAFMRALVWSSASAVVGSFSTSRTLWWRSMCRSRTIPQCPWARCEPSQRMALHRRCRHPCLSLFRSLRCVKVCPTVRRS